MFDYTKVLSSTVTEMKPSGIRKFFDILQGREDVVGLTVGQPDFVTPWHIREAGIDSLKDGKTYYYDVDVEIQNYGNGQGDYYWYKKTLKEAKKTHEFTAYDVY